MEQEPQKLGKYSLVRHIATGGMAEIWLADQVGPGGFSKQLVIKRILEHNARDTHFIQMFLDEARLVAQLSHPNIAQIYELGAIEGTYFIAMEYIRGLDLSDLIQHASAQGAYLPVGLTVRIVLDVLQALDYAHTFVDQGGQHAGIVHRDVTPHNVLVSTNGVAKLVDFGVAKARDNESKTETGAVKGKFAYMSPEQIEGKQPDARMDLFAVGVMLFELLTNMRPFGDDLGAIHAILSRPHPDPRDIRAEIPQSIVNILDLALAKDADQRYQSAAAMAADLEEFSRASGQYSSQSDVALFVCDVLDIPPPVTQRHTSDGPRARITERERSIDVSEAPTNSLSLPDVGSPTVKTSPPKQAEPTALVKLSNAADDVDAATPSSGGSQGKLVALFGVVIVGILGAALVVGYLVVSSKNKGKPDPKPKVVVKDKGKPDPKPKPVDAKPDWSVLMSPDGIPVTLNSKVPARLYYKGVWIGKTPLTIPLAKGEYTVQFKRERGDGEGALKVTVDGSTKALQVFEFKGF